MPKPSRKTLKAKADRLFSQYIRARDGFCRACLRTDSLQCAHGFSRRYHSTRWDETNAWALCAACHLRFTHDPIRWELWMREALGDKGYDALRAKAITITKPNYEAIIEELQAKLKGAA